ncbi:MAG: tyrosine-type recombinase/integrase [Phycisphaerae bacterium]
MSVYLRSQENSAGRAARSGKYWISFTDHQEIRRRMPALTDRRQSEALERQIKSLAAARVGGDSGTLEQERFIAGLPKAMVKKLVRWDILPGAKLEAARPLADQIADYIAAMTALGRADSHCQNCRRFLERMASACGWTRVTDITPDSIGKWRDNLQQIVKAGNAGSKDIKPKPASARTKNAYVKAARSFVNWMVRQGRMNANPLNNIGNVEERGREVRIRRAFTDDEVLRLLGVAGDYSTVYLLALTTGLRRGELRALQWADVHLDAIRPFINVRASISKNHGTADMYLRQDVIDALRAIAGADAGRVCKMPGRKRFKSHLAAAKIPAKDSTGRVVDFHALRHTFITALQRGGVSPRVAMELARHSRMELTMKTYTDATMLATADALDALPAWAARKGESPSQAKLATGTDPRPLTGGPETAVKKRDAKRDAEGGKGRILPDFGGQSTVLKNSGQEQGNAELMRVSSASEKSGRQDTNRTFCRYRERLGLAGYAITWWCCILKTV